jgi:hypothetical protein
MRNSNTPADTRKHYAYTSWLEESYKKSEDLNNKIFRCMPNFSLWEWKHKETDVW